MQTIQKPANGMMAVEVSDKEIELKFSAAEGRMSRVENGLVFEFDDGSSVVLDGFYSNFSKEDLPTFIVEGIKIPCGEFFAALGAENLMPPAGPDASQTAVQGGHYTSWSEMALLEGLARLGHLDIGFNGSREVTDTLHAEGVSDDRNNKYDNEKELVDPIPEPEPYTTTAHLDIPSVFEGQPIIGKIALDNPPTEDCIIQVRIGGSIIDVPVPAGSTEVKFTADNPNGEDPFIDASSIEAEIVSINGGGYNDITIEEPSTIGILDTIDEVKFFISGEAIDETAETARFAITSDDPVQTGSLEVVVNIGGIDYSIDMELVDGSWTGHINVPVRENDLLINGKDAIKAYVVSASHDGHEWENPSYGNATEATVVDNVDDAVFNTAITVENGQYIVEVTSAQPHSSDGHPSVTLTVNGAERKIDLHWDEARELWTESVAYDVPEPGLDDETLHVEASISSPSMNGLEYENPVLNPATKDIFIEHEHRDVQAQLDIPAVFEGSEITGTVILDIPPLEDCTITVKVGDTTIEVPVKANETEATFFIENPNGEDPFIDASSIEAEIVSINGGRYDDVELPEASTVDILDTIDEVKFSITGQDVDENAKMVIFTVTSDDPVQTGSLVVTVDVDGTEHSVEMEWNGNGWTGILSIPVRTDDLLVNGKDAFNAQIVNASHNGKVWENPDYGKSAEATVVDDKDDVIFNAAIAVEDGQYVVEVTSAQPNSSEGHPSVTLTVNGEDQRLDLQWDIARKLWTASSTFDLPAPTHSDETVHVEASISSPSMLGLEYENPICNPAVKDIVVEHEYWPVNASLDIPPAFEGDGIVGKIVLDNPPVEDCTATIKVGDAEIEVPVPAGSTKVEFIVENPNGEDPFIDASSIEAEIVSINGGGYDEINLDNPVNVDILDTIDEVKFTITGEHLDETAKTATFIITSDDPVQTGSLTVAASIDGNEYPVQMEWTDNGWTGTINVPVRENDLLINGKDTIEAYVVSASHDGKVWENPNYGGKTESTVIDNVDDAVFNTSISVENGQYVVEVTSVQPNSNDGHPILTLKVNGKDRQINLHWDDAREMWVESVAFNLPAPTHSDKTVHVEASISNPSMLGLEYENPILNPAVKDIVVEHEWWPVYASLEIPSVFEGNEIAGKIILDKAPFENCIAIIAVGNKVIEVPIQANAMEASFTVVNPNGEDPFIDASSIEAYIESINGGGYDEVNLEEIINVDILDTIDEVKFAITGDVVDETATTATFTITSDDPVQTGSLTVVASIGGIEHSVAMELVDGSWIGHIEVPVRENDLLINGKDTIDAYIVSAKHDSYEWENPNYGGKTEATVIDNIDDAVFNTAINVVDGQYIVEVTSIQPYSAEGHPSLTLTVNGDSQQINLHWDEAREFWTESAAFDLPAPTHSDETVHVEASISNPSMLGLEYENPILNSATKDIVVEHEWWPVNASLEVPSVFEGNEIAGKVILDKAPFEDGCIAIVKIGDETIEVPVSAGAMEATFSVANPNGEDPFIDASTIQAEIIEITGGGYDSVETEAPIDVNILDTINEVKFTIAGQDVEETAASVIFTVTSDDPVHTGTLTVVASIDGNEYNVPMEWTAENGWTGSVEVPVRDNDLLINGKDTIDAYIVSAQHDSYTWENPNYGEATASTIVDNVDDAVFNTSITVADGQYVVEVTSVQPSSEDGHPTLTLTVNGEEQSLDLHWDEARELWTESVAFDLPAQTHEDQTVHVEASISNPSMLGLEYENPILNSATKDIVVEHEYWPVNATLDIPSVFEGNEIAGRIILDNAPIEDCIAIVVVGDNSIRVPISAGATEASFVVDNPNGEDPFIDASAIEAHIESIEGGRYDSVEVEEPITVNILDTIDEVDFSISGENVDETAASVTFTVVSDDPVQTGTLTVVASIDGNEYTVPMEWIEGAGWTGQVEVPVRENDLLINGKDTIDAYVVSARHDSYEWENPNYGKATEATVVDNVDDAIFNTAITASDGQYIVEITSTQPNSTEGHPTLTLTVNGESQQIDLHWDDVREIWTESVSFDLPAPTHSDETVHVEASISNPSMLGLEYENPILNPAVKDIVVEHEYWPVNAHLEVPSVFEGNEIAGKVILDNAPVDDCIATVKVGNATVEVPVEAGNTEASFTIDNPNTEDPFIDASSVQAEIVSIDGGRYDEINLEDSIEVSILDTIDKVTFAIAGEHLDETAETTVFTITSDDPVQTGTLTVVASIDSIEYTVPMHWTESGWAGQIEVPVRENDLLINGKDTIEAYVVSAQHDTYEWENPDYGKATEATVIDNKDDAVFDTSITVNETAYVVEVTSAQPNSTEGHPTLTLTVNGESQQIDLHWDEARELWIESVSFDLPAPGINDETLHIEASISDPSMLGLQYENPILNPTRMDIFIEHEPYNVYAHLEVPAVFEGNDIVGTIILDNPPREDCTALVKVGDTLIEVPLPANVSEVEFTVENPNTEDPFIDTSSVEAQIMAINGGGYDARDLEEPVTVNILDTIDEVKFAVSGIDVDENADKLVVNVTSDDPVTTGSLVVQVQVDGEDHFVTMQWTEEDGWTGKLELPVREDNVLIDGIDAVKVEIVNAVHDNHVWENPNYDKELELHVTDDNDAVTFNTGLSVVDGACIVNVSCDQKPDEGVINADLMLNGQPHSITLEWNDDAQSWTASMTIPLPSATVDGQSIHIEAIVANPSMNGKEYENPLFNSSILNVNMDAGKDSMAVDESYIPTGSHNPEDTGSDEASIYLGGSSTLFGHLNWSLEILEQPDNLVALIDGLEREVELVKEEDARIVGRIHLNKSEDRDVFEIAIDDDGNATVKLLGGASLVHGDPATADEAIDLDGIRAVWTEGEETGWKDLHISFQDDAPWIGSTESHVVDPINAGYAVEVRNLIDCGPGIDFTHGKSGARFINDVDGLQFWAAEGVTLAPGIVQYAEDGWTPLEMIGIKDSLEGRSHWLQYSAHGSNNASPWNWGLDVHSGARWEHGREISHDIIMHQGQAVVVNLDGKLAYGITVEFGACYDPTSTVMANDRQFPEAATIIFYRNGKMVGWETATGLSKGQDERTFGSAIADGFDKAIISVPDNHSIDPNPRNGYPEVSDNDWTIRKIDFTTHPQEQPIHASEGNLDIHASADGWMIGEKTVSFWEDMIGDSINVTLEDGTEHLVTVTYPSKASCIQGTLEDGSILFQGVVGADGHWTFGQYRDFSFEDSNTIPLWFKTGKDADGDWTGNSVDVQTNGFGDASVSIPLEVSIDSTDGVLPASSWWSVPVKADIDEDHLGNGSWVQIDVGNGSSIASHTLQWNGDGFTTNDGFSFNWDGSKLTWNEATPDVGKLLTVAVTQHWIDESGLDHEAFSFASAQRDVNGTPPPLTMQASADPLMDDLANAKIASMMFADIPDSPSAAPMDSTTSDSAADMSIGSEMLCTQASSTELDTAIMTTMHQGG